MKYISSEALILIPALYVVGMILKNTPKFKDWLIPYVLLALGVMGAVGILGFNVKAVIQGILVTGTTVFTNQLIKQAKDREE